MASAGASIIDLGAESTRPGGGVYGDGAVELSAEEELRRLIPVLERLRAETDLALSVDTRKGAVAAKALEAGADLINDVGGLQDPELATAVANAGCPVIAMHSRGELGTMQVNTEYEDLLGEVAADLQSAIERGREAGISTRQIIVDPGIGFGKEGAQNLQILAHFERLHALGSPLLIGASRKSFIGYASGATVADRLPGSLAAAAWALSGGAQILRVHDVAETRQFVDVWRAIEHQVPKVPGPHSQAGRKSPQTVREEGIAR